MCKGSARGMYNIKYIEGIMYKQFLFRALIPLNIIT
jgi:hypothetical protein